MIAAAAFLVGGFATTPARAQPVASRGQDYTFAFQDAEIAQVVQAVLGEAGVTYAIDPGVTGRITFRIEQRLTRDQLTAALEAALAANGVAVVRDGGQLLITPQSKAKSSASIRRGAEGVGGAGYEMVAVPLAYAQPSEVSRALEAISGANTVLYANDKLGLLLLGGSGSSLKAALDALKIFDQSAFQATKIRWFELNQAEATIVAAELDRIVQGAGLVGVAVVPLKRLNGVIIFGRSGESLDELSKWVLRLDTPGKEAGSTLWVYRPRHGSAESMARTLSSVLATPGQYGTSSLTPGGAGASGGTTAPVNGTPTGAATYGSGADEVRIGVDKDTNTMLVVAPAPRWIQIQRILNEVDRPPRQVLIEASILEVTLGQQFKFGVDWSLVSGDFAIGSINNGSGAVGAVFPGLSVTYLRDDIRAAINALGTKTSLEVVSAPKIIALDNKTARLQVGDQVPVIVQSAQSTDAANAPVVSSVEYRSTGVILTVTPRISGDDQLVLEVSQEVSSVSPTASSGIDSPTIQQRRFESTLILRSGGVVALGGMISSNRSNDNGGVPWLKDVPGVGSLFRTEGRSNNRSELIILLTAKIITDEASSQRVYQDLLDDMKELRSRGVLPPQK